jgi:hypothetical protein
MGDYQNYGVKLTTAQAKKIMKAHKNTTSITIRLSKSNLHGNYKLPLTQTQIDRITKAKNGVQIKLSEMQLKHMEKTGGFIPLLTLIPIIASALGAAGGVAGGIASAVNSSKANSEQERHNRAIEGVLAKEGSGIVSDFAGKIPLLGSFLGPLLQKIGLGIGDIKKISKGGCVCHNGCKIKQMGSGLYLEPHGEGLFLGPRR